MAWAFLRFNMKLGGVPTIYRFTACRPIISLHETFCVISSGPIGIVAASKACRMQNEKFGNNIFRF